MIRPRSDFFEILRDPDEGPFLEAIARRPDDHSLWLAYADRLEELRDGRGEFLRLECLLSSPDRGAEITPAQQARYQELLGLLDQYGRWIRLVKRNDRILNCGKATAEPLTVRFRYECPNQWETLAPTGEAGVRYCGGCQRNVYFCDSSESVELHACGGDCIAVPTRLTGAVGRELTRFITGRPDVHELWARKVFGQEG
jgi:uncharacterized protein (TIGR02996 family)